MKKLLLRMLTLSLVSCITLSGFCQKKLLKELKMLGYDTDNVIRVSDIREFVAAVHSNTVILVDTGSYTFTDSFILGSEEEKQALDKFYELSDNYDTNTYFHDLENVAIIGDPENPPLFLQRDYYNHVMKFRNVKNLMIRNVRMGHEEGSYCMGGVILVVRGENVTLDHVELFGSGTEGLSLIDVDHFSFLNSVVTGCTEQLSSFSNVQNGIIDNCRFVENTPGLRGFAIYKSALTFTNSVIAEKYPFYYDPTLYTGDYDYLFVIDQYDYGEWYVDRYEAYPLNDDLAGSVITFSETTINDELVNCIYQNIQVYSEEYDETYYDEGNSDYSESEYEEYYDGFYEEDNDYLHVKTVYLKDLTVSFYDSVNYWSGPWEEAPESDSIDINPAEGEDPQGSIIYIGENSLKDIRKVEQQFVTIAVVYTENEYIAFPDWKKNISEWFELKLHNDTSYVSHFFDYDGMYAFPEFEISEIIDQLKLRGYEDTEERTLEDLASYWSIALYKISYRITAIDQNNKEVIRLINFYVPTHW